MMAPIRPDRVAIYIRWSTDDQSEGTTLDVQLEGCRHYVLSQGWQHSPSLLFIDDGWSGGSLARPALTRLREAVQQGQVDCVVVFKIDRLSRNVVDTVNLVLREWDGKCHVKSAREAIDTATQQGRMFFYTLISFAEWERSVIRERTMAGRLRRLQEGRNPGFRPPYGLGTGPTPGSFVLLAHEAAVVQRIFAMYSRGLGYKAIAVALSRDGIAFRDGRPWSAQTVAAVLRNPIYTGRLAYGRRGAGRGQAEATVVHSPHLPPILSAEAFEAAQTQRTRRAVERAPNRAASSGHLLTGLLRCGRCGSAMMGRKKYGQAEQVPYYICAGQRAKGTAFCNNAYVRQEELDRWLQTQVLDRFGSAMGEQRYVTRANSEQEQRAAAAARAAEEIRRELAALDRELDVIGRDYRRERLTAEEYREQRAAVGRERERLGARLAELAARATPTPPPSASALPLHQRWHALTLPQQKQVLRSLIARLTVYRQPGATEITCDLTWPTA
jgi:site-specific DNA recombinase